jgi:uncharacterized protein YndB with AHSA1/START domain
MAKPLDFKRVIKGKPEDIFYAFSTTQGWRDWLCDSALIQARAGGCYQFAWNNGWFAAGTLETFERPKKIVMTWRGKGDPASSEVTIALSEADTGTQVSLTHAGFGEGETWEEIRTKSHAGWETALENLVSIFDTGVDLRQARRPMLGVAPGEFNEKIADELGVPTTEGVLIDKPLEGMGAEKAGLQPNDVIVKMGDTQIRGFSDLPVALQEYQAGDVIPTTVHRGAERLTVELELSSRPFAEVPLDPAEIADQMKVNAHEIYAAVRAVFDGVSESEASFNPTPEEWSAKETLAHLIDSQSYPTGWILELLNDGEREYTGEGANVRARLESILETTPTIPELLQRYEMSQNETLSLLSKADKLKARPGVLWRVGQMFLQFPDLHERGHIEQMRAAIQASRTS